MSSFDSAPSPDSAPSLDLASRLDRAVMYQIYPQSFADANGDGIGDLAGIADRLDYLQWLGIDVVWINPCFVSPFQDAGYDVADYTRVAPRYGTNDDVAHLAAEAAKRGIAVLLDLVAGHTSDQHPWFIASANDPDDHRFIWSNKQLEGFEPGPGARNGFYKPNFFACQPALNYGYARMNPDEPWRQPVDAEGPMANRAALQDIMAFWFDQGVAGFRVDMASSLIKDDPGFVETGKLWTQMRGWLDRKYPGRILVAEWGDPRVSVPAGFHLDHFLQFGGGNDGQVLRSLWNNGAGTVEDHWDDLPAWADGEARGDTSGFIAAWRDAMAAINAAGRGGVPGLPTSNHDFTRLVAGARDADQARAAFVLTMTWAAMPSIYYGDEIGMRYVPGTPALEGSRLGPKYDRAGSRTPMQWGAVPDGTFGPGNPAESRYLPMDPDPARPTVAAQYDDENSLLRLVRDLVGLRHTDRRLDIGSSTQVLTTGYPMAFVRGGSLLVVINPGAAAASVDVTRVPGRELLDRGSPARQLLGRGASWVDGAVRVEGHGYAVFDLVQ